VIEAYQFFITHPLEFAVQFLITVVACALLQAIPALIDLPLFAAVAVYPVQVMIMAVFFYKIAFATLCWRLELTWDGHGALPAIALFILYLIVPLLMGLAALLFEDPTTRLGLGALGAGYIFCIGPMALLAAAACLDRRKAADHGLGRILRRAQGLHLIYFSLTLLGLLGLAGAFYNLPGMIGDAPKPLDAIARDTALAVLVLAPIPYLSIQFFDYLKKVARQQTA
jgi:hypothetical protein